MNVPHVDGAGEWEERTVSGVEGDGEERLNSHKEESWEPIRRSGWVGWNWSH